MKPELKLNPKDLSLEVSLSSVMEEDEDEMHKAYMSECMVNDEMFVNTAGMCSSDAKYMCGMSYMKNRPMLSEMAGQLTEKQKTLPPALQKAILDRMRKSEKLNDEGKKEGESMGMWQEAKAEPTAVFVEQPAPPSGEITEKAAEEGLKVDEKLQKEQEAAAPSNPGLQSETFDKTK